MYKSPTAKLLKFFPLSRDRWKAKCQVLRRANKKLTNQTRAVEKSRAHWREQARAAQQRVAQLEREMEGLKCFAAQPG